ncbi:hypothetical protein RUND412_002381 [Rhizina undulata]
MYANLKLLHTTKNFYLRHSFKPEYLPNPNVYNNPYHPLYFNAREKFDNLEPQLIINITATKKAVAGKATVRNRAVRRVRMATWDLLRERGYTKDGRVRNQKAKIAGEKRDIISTLAFWPTQEAVKADVEVGLEKFLAAHEIIRAKEVAKVKPQQDEVNHSSVSRWRGQCCSRCRPEVKDTKEKLSFLLKPKGDKQSKKEKAPKADKAEAPKDSAE